jgi:hypothetical protein
MTSVHFPDVRFAIDFATEMRLGTIDGDATEDGVGSILSCFLLLHVEDDTVG